MVRDGTSSGLPWSSHSDRPAIAVLPFENLSGDPDQAYFSDGMTEEVMTELSRFRELVVIARGSSAAFSSKDRDVRAVGRQLGASYLLEGSVRRAANRVRISAQLLEAATGANVWADRYDRPMEDIFAIQEEIAQSIVARVAQHVRDDSGARARRRQPEDLRAYDLYIQGNGLSDDLTPEIQAKIEGLFREARRIDPTFARAYSGLSYVTLNRSLDGGIRPYRTDDDDQLEALRLAEEALVLDPNDPRIHMTFGFTCLYLRQFARAQRHLDLARTMNPNDPTIQMVWAWAQGASGSRRKACRQRLSPSGSIPIIPGGTKLFSVDCCTSYGAMPRRDRCWSWEALPRRSGSCATLAGERRISPCSGVKERRTALPACSSPRLPHSGAEASKPVRPSS